MVLLSYYVGYNFGNNEGVWKILEEGCKKDYIFRFEGIDFVCLGMKGERIYDLGFCFFEVSGV